MTKLKTNRKDDNLQKLSKKIPHVEKKTKLVNKTIVPKEEKLNHFQSKKNFEKKNKMNLFYKNPQNLNSMKLIDHPYNDMINENHHHRSNIIKSDMIPNPNLGKNNSLSNINNNSKNKHKIIGHHKGINSEKSLNYSQNNYINNNSNKKELIKDLKDYTENNKESHDNKKIENIKNINNYNIKKIKDSCSSIISENNIKKINEAQNESKSNKTYSESDLGEVGGEIIEDEDSEFGKEINELNDTDEANYYEPKSIVNYSIFNFTNKKNRRHQSLSVSKETKMSYSPFHNSPKASINKNLFKFRDKNNNNNNHYHIKLPVQNLDKNIKIIKIKNLNDKINMKKNDIDRLNIIIGNMQKEIRKYDNEIRKIDNFIQKEEQEEKEIRQMINFFLIMK